MENIPSFFSWTLCRVKIVYSEAHCEAYLFFQAFVGRGVCWGFMCEWSEMKRGTSFNWLGDLGRLHCCNILNSIFVYIVANMLIPGYVSTFIGRKKWIRGCLTCILMPRGIPEQTRWAVQTLKSSFPLLSLDSTDPAMCTARDKSALWMRNIFKCSKLL